MPIKYMRLVIGANASGKLEYIKTLGYTDSDIASSGKKVLYKLNLLIDELMKSEDDVALYIEQMLSAMPYEIIVCDEIGGGVVPLNRYERDLREQVGRACCKIAAQADVVTRIYCGIPTTIKCEAEDKKSNES